MGSSPPEPSSQGRLPITGWLRAFAAPLNAAAPLVAFAAADQLVLLVGLELEPASADGLPEKNLAIDSGSTEPRRCGVRAFKAPCLSSTVPLGGPSCCATVKETWKSGSL